MASTVIKDHFYIVTAKTEENFDIGDVVEANATIEDDSDDTNIPNGMFYAVCANDDGDWLASGYLSCSSVEPLPVPPPAGEMSKVAAYLERGKTYLVLDLDENFREVGRQVVPRSDLPQAVAEKCDRYQPHDFREVRIS